MHSDDVNCKRIRAPEFDISSLVKDNALTMIGGVVNPKEQPIGALISALPRKWTLKGVVTGSDLGLNCFQFRFELEEDLVKVLAQRPYHYNYWMVILQRWEPVISPSFPSQIPFWIRLHGLPLHFWHHKMIYNIGQDLGTLEDYKIRKTSARIRVLLDGLKSLTKKAVVEFDSGEELMINLDYEDLEYHCSRCNRLSHLARPCPLAVESLKEPTPSSLQPAERHLWPVVSQSERPPQKRVIPTLTDSVFRSRVDRHGNPFGDRIALPAQRGRPLSNKLVPLETSHQNTSRARFTQGPSSQRKSPSKVIGGHQGGPHKVQSNQLEPQRWRVKQTHPTEAPESSQTPVNRALSLPGGSRPPLSRNLDRCDFPPIRDWDPDQITSFGGSTRGLLSVHQLWRPS